jgi:hypothetical protein
MKKAHRFRAIAQSAALLGAALSILGGPSLASAEGGGFASALLPPIESTTLTTTALLDTLQHTAFDFFWDQANPANGLIRDRWPTPSPCSIASVGFGLSAICIGIDHGWITREEGRDRVLTTLNTFWTYPQGPDVSGTIGYKGLFYHFLDMNTGERTWSCELSTIDTALLFAGIIDAREYFDGDDAEEVQIRALADSITGRADWDYMRNGGAGIRMGWKPETGFSGFGEWVGYNEAMILYLLAIGSPTFPVPGVTWIIWTSGYSWQTQYGYEYVVFPPLFGHQYSHCWIDFRSIQDSYMQLKGITYFENSRRATLAQREYCIANPGGWTGYGENVWGITASDTPTGYMARGAPPPQNDEGTITPTAVAGSIAFAPEVTIPTLHHWYDTYRPQLFSIYGFVDAFNLTVNWWDSDYIGIDEGPIILMIENYRTGKVWERVMGNANVQAGLALAGFGPATGVPPRQVTAGSLLAIHANVPNPFRESSVISYTIPAGGATSLGIYDVAGRLVRTLVDGPRPAGTYRVTLEGRDLPAGVYFCRLQTAAGRTSRKIHVLR